MYYLFISSRDSIQSHPNNNSFDFTIELPKPLITKGPWECALLDVQYNHKPKTDVVIYADICMPSYISDSNLPVLQTIHSPGIIQYPYFIPMISGDISRIKVFIRSGDRRLPAFHIDELKCTLVLRRVL